MLVTMERVLRLNSSKISEVNERVKIEYDGGVTVEIPTTHSMGMHLSYAISHNEKNIAEVLSVYIFSNITIVPDKELYMSFLDDMNSYIERNKKEYTEKENEEALEQTRVEFEMFEECLKNEK